MDIKSRILLVDNEERWRQRLEEILCDGFDVSQAQDYDKAVEKINDVEKPFDIVITEIHLDKGQQDEAGFALVGCLKNLELHTKIIFLTHYGDVSYAIRATEAHIKFLEKNKIEKIDNDDFLKIIENTLSEICVYVFMSFSSKSTRFYNKHIKRIVEKCERADTVFEPDVILKKVIDGICKSKIILADVSEGKLDVYFEAGLAQALYRSVLILSQGEESVPILMDGLERVPYNQNNIKGFDISLTKAIQDVKTNGYPHNLKKVDGIEVRSDYCLALIPRNMYGMAVFEDIIFPATNKGTVKCEPVSRILANNNITQKIWEEMHRAKFIVVDLGLKDKDVLYLTGLAYGLGRDVILLVKEKDDLPHCLRSATPVTYTGLEKTRKEDIQNLGYAIQSVLGTDPIEWIKMKSELDIVILTVLPEEYQAIKSQIPNLEKWPGEKDNPSLYAWQTGIIPSKNSHVPYKVALGMIGRAGNTNSALAVRDAMERWSPRYVFFVGVAGGLNKLEKGDVVLADVIYGYEYGKLEKKFNPRTDWSYRTDQGLLNGATAYDLDNYWKNFITITPPQSSRTKFTTGTIASGEKVVDDPTSEFFAQVLDAWPRIKAVEMEGAGVASATEQAHALGKNVGFIVVRGISDVPRPPEEKDAERGAKERDNWKPYASAAAAAFTVGYIADGLPVPPKESN
jgi:nucleoside phosphorylase/ActR/RegA family two-component response regulator